MKDHTDHHRELRPPFSAPTPGPRFPPRDLSTACPWDAEIMSARLVRALGGVTSSLAALVLGLRPITLALASEESTTLGNARANPRQKSRPTKECWRGKQRTEAQIRVPLARAHSPLCSLSRRCAPHLPVPAAAALAYRRKTAGTSRPSFRPGTSHSHTPRPDARFDKCQLKCNCHAQSPESGKMTPSDTRAGPDGSLQLVSTRRDLRGSCQGVSGWPGARFIPRRTYASGSKVNTGRDNSNPGATTSPKLFAREAQYTTTIRKMTPSR